MLPRSAVILGIHVLFDPCPEVGGAGGRGAGQKGIGAGGRAGGAGDTLEELPEARLMVSRFRQKSTNQDPRSGIPLMGEIP